MKKKYIAFAAAALAALTLHADDKALTGDELMEKANQAFYYAGKDGRSEVEMTIRDNQGGTRSRSMTILRLNDGADQKYYVYFKAPADVRRMAFLVWKKDQGDDDRWLFLPALNLERRIAPGDKRTSFVGSDFFYEDVSGRSLKDDTHELIETTDEHYILLNKPVAPGTVEFAEYKVWLDKKTYLPMRSEYYDANGKLYRTVVAEKVEEIDGFPTIMVSTASDLVNGSSTVNTFSNVKYNLGLKDRIFTAFPAASAA